MSILAELACKSSLDKGIITIELHGHQCSNVITDGKLLKESIQSGSCFSQKGMTLPSKSVKESSVELL